jgi:hypothetical protein
MKSKILTLSMIFILSLGLRNTAFAAPEIVGEGDVFDADYYTDNGKQDLAANAVGRYDGKKILTFPEENTSFFVVKSDGNWTMTPLY